MTPLPDAEYTIVSVKDGYREWSTGFGTFHAYRCDLATNDGSLTYENVEVNYKPDSQPPSPQDKVFGSIDLEAQYGPKLKKTSNPNFGGAGGPGQRPGPAERKHKAADGREESIERQVAAKCAAQVLAAHDWDHITPAKIRAITDAFAEAIKN